MTLRKWATVVGYCILTAGMTGSICRAAESDRAAVGQATVPAWATVIQQTVSLADARLLENAAHRFYDLLKMGRKDAAYALLAPEATRGLGDQFDPKHREVVSIDNVGAPQLLSQHWARVEATVTWKELDAGPQQGKSSSQHDVLYFRLCDPKYLIRFQDAGGPEAAELPITAAGVPPWWTLPKWKAEDPMWPEMVARTNAAFARKWAGWDQDPQKLWGNIQGWWAQQSKDYGTYAWASLSPRYVAMSGDSAVVEASHLFSVGADGGTRATYRYRLVQDSTIEDPPTLKEHLQWRIADTCLVKAEKLTADQVASAVSAGGAAGGCGCGCGGSEGAEPKPPPPPKPAEGEGGCGCSDMDMSGAK